MSRHLWITDFSSGALPASDCYASVYDEGNAKYTVRNQKVSTETLGDFNKSLHCKPNRTYPNKLNSRSLMRPIRERGLRLTISSESRAHGCVLRRYFQEPMLSGLSSLGIEDAVSVMSGVRIVVMLRGFPLQCIDCAYRREKVYSG